MLPPRVLITVLTEQKVVGASDSHKALDGNSGLPPRRYAHMIAAVVREEVLNSFISEVSVAELLAW